MILTVPCLQTSLWLTNMIVFSCISGYQRFINKRRFILLLPEEGKKKSWYPSLCIWNQTWAWVDLVSDRIRYNIRAMTLGAESSRKILIGCLKVFCNLVPGNGTYQGILWQIIGDHCFWKTSLLCQNDEGDENESEQ